MPELTVTSEIYEEYDYGTKITPSKEGNIISEFPFMLKHGKTEVKFDEDNDLDVERPTKHVIKIEHSSKTRIALVGLQVWRGAFLLGDLLIHLGLKGDLDDKTVLELGAGTGLTSFVAAMFAKNVICTECPAFLPECPAKVTKKYTTKPVCLCSVARNGGGEEGEGTRYSTNQSAHGVWLLLTYYYTHQFDINLGGILDLIRVNAQYNSKLIKSDFKILPLDFAETNWSSALTNEIKNTDIVIAADVIYDDDVTAAFVSTIQKILNIKPPKTLYVVLEKRYVFTIEHLDSVAPCYETFLTLLDKIKTENVQSTWKIEQLPLDFPKYFIYDRVKHLVLWKITSTPT